MFKWALDRGDTAVVDLLLQFNPALVDVKNNVSSTRLALQSVLGLWTLNRAVVFLCGEWMKNDDSRGLNDCVCRMESAR